MAQRVGVEEYLKFPLVDSKINGKSCIVKMRIGDYLKMAGIESNPYQRNLQNLTFYRNLIKDLLNDTIMPPISVVYPEDEIDFQNGLNVNKKFIIIDGLQRTNCLLECREIIESGKSEGLYKKIDDFNNKEVYVEIWNKLDLKNILYKMVVLNTGQKKMDYGHQLDILSESIKDVLEKESIEYFTQKDRVNGNKKQNTFELSTVTAGLVSFINKSPMQGKKNAAEFLFERFNIGLGDDDDASSGLNLIEDEETYRYFLWVIRDFDGLLNEKYGEQENPIRKYDVFLISLFASLGYCYSKRPANLSLKIKVLEEKFKRNSDPINLKDFEKLYSTFKTGIGDKRRKFIYETFRNFFLMPEHVDEVEWVNTYNDYFKLF